MHLRTARPPGRAAPPPPGLTPPPPLDRLCCPLCPRGALHKTRCTIYKKLHTSPWYSLPADDDLHLPQVLVARVRLARITPCSAGKHSAMKHVRAEECVSSTCLYAASCCGVSQCLLNAPGRAFLTQIHQASLGETLAKPHARCARY